MLANRMLMCMNKKKIDHLTPVTVVTSAYTASNTARPQRLSNGWIVTCALNGSNLYFYVSKDNGSTWNQLCWSYNITSSGYSITSYGTMIYLLFSSGSGLIQLIKFDATTVTNVNLYLSGSLIIDTQTITDYGRSITVSSIGVLTAVWCSKNSTYPNNYNIRSAKSIDGGVTWTKQDGTPGIDQITQSNSSDTYYSNPYVLYTKNDNPIIIYDFMYSVAPNCKIMAKYFNGVSWQGGNPNYGYGLNVFDGLTRGQWNPIATLQKYGINAGRIWVTWSGIDDTDNTQSNIKVAYSDDNGVTWSAMTKLTSGNTYSQSLPTIASDKNGNIYVIWFGLSPTSSGFNRIRSKKWNGISWGSIIDVTNNTTNHMDYQSVCDNYNDFVSPIAIWRDRVNVRIAFSSVFYV